MKKFTFTVQQNNVYTKQFEWDGEDAEDAEERLSAYLEEHSLENMKDTYDGIELTITYEEAITLRNEIVAEQELCPNCNCIDSSCECTDEEYSNPKQPGSDAYLNKADEDYERRDND